nr:immunoglobulin light chain junction region [Macaca mulatta]MOX98850.1 immunoglobulin light chain junction region [Macaca mulatta]MOX99978.1 immunoglobulin light chain junction region [Macaca mulatta]MOY00014.1 immunoglobulin light chain junction region [Macaca mulatta]
CMQAVEFPPFTF